MRTSQLTLVLAALLVGATLKAPAQNAPDQKEIEQKRSQEKFRGKTLFEWSNDLRHPDLSVQIEAIAAIKWYGSAARHEVPMILKNMSHKDGSMKANAIITLGFVGVDPKDAEAAVKKLSALMYDSQHIVRYQAIRTLMQLGADFAYDATPALINALTDSYSIEIRSAAADALGYVAWTSKGFDLRAFRGLVQAANDPNNVASVRLAAVSSLILFGKPTAEANLRWEEKVLHGLTLEKQQGKRFSEKVAIWAYLGLMRIDDRVSDAHLTGISKFLKSKDMQSRQHAARALAVIGPLAGSQVTALTEALDKEEDPTTIIWMITALGNMKDRAKDAAPFLKKFVAHKEQAVRDAANKALLDFQEKPRIDDTPVKPKKQKAQ